VFDAVFAVLVDDVFFYVDIMQAKIQIVWTSKLTAL
jgi:hypothetical protein